jgi:hypothetical protein
MKQWVNRCLLLAICEEWFSTERAEDLLSLIHIGFTKSSDLVARRRGMARENLDFLFTTGEKTLSECFAIFGLIHKSVRYTLMICNRLWLIEVRYEGTEATVAHLSTTRLLYLTRRRLNEDVAMVRPRHDCDDSDDCGDDNDHDSKSHSSAPVQDVRAPSPPGRIVTDVGVVARITGEVLEDFAAENVCYAEVPLRSVIPARPMYTKPSHSGARIATPDCRVPGPEENLVTPLLERG